MITFVYGLDEKTMGTPHRVTGLRDEVPVGYLAWSRTSGLILDVQVVPAHRRQGVATALLAEARRVAAATRGIAAPRLSPYRTDDGQAWGLSLGERLPRRRH